MNLRNVLKPVATVLLTVGLVTVGVAGPADAATRPTHTTNDTGWGFK
jgi:hypothetical protein